MASPSQTLAKALQHHQTGQFTEAEQLYRQVLALEPQNIAAWHLLGRLADQLGHPSSAVQCLQQAITIRPDYAEAHSDLGTILEAQGKLPEAAVCYRRALELNPGDASTHFNLGNVQRQQGDRGGATASFRTALTVNPELSPAHFNLGRMLTEDGRLDEAVAHFQRALTTSPHDPAILIGLGFALQQQGKTVEALDQYRSALLIAPNNVDALYNLATIFEQQEKHDDALVSYRRVLVLNPDHVGANTNLGLLLWNQGDLAEAVVLLQRALSIEPDCPEALHNLGIVFGEQDKWEEMLACFNRAIELNPNLAQARLNRAHHWLLLGDFEQGWPEYEWRWKTSTMRMPHFEQPKWSGQSLAGKTILLHAEQGYGDTLQFIRYAPLLKQLGASVIVQCSQAIAPLLTSCRDINKLIALDDELPPFDFHSPLMSLPGIVETRLPTIPASVPYLFADPTLVVEWRDKLNAAVAAREASNRPGKFLIGINWHGRGGNRVHRQRDIPLEYFLPLAKLPGVRLVNLQKEGHSERSAGFPTDIIDLGQDLDAKHGAFMDTAAIMMNLDLIITSDTAIPHLAGALGVPVWVALKYSSDWRWLLHRNDSPWYPTMRLFRQQPARDWSTVFAEIQQSVIGLLEERRLATMPHSQPSQA